MLIKKCPNCKIYTLKELCPNCKIKTISAHPIKFSLEKEKKYSKYRNI
ncbi:MAG: nucleolar RNA-binding Nop10p family protein [Candidatus Aenigmatarchaeota archaeon]